MSSGRYTLGSCAVLASEHKGRLAVAPALAFDIGAEPIQISTLRRWINLRDWRAPPGQRCQDW